VIPIFAGWVGEINRDRDFEELIKNSLLRRSPQVITGRIFHPLSIRYRKGENTGFADADNATTIQTCNCNWNWSRKLSKEIKSTSLDSYTMF
jgi:hypothetical protein